jgi:hypothetical protein
VRRSVACEQPTFGYQHGKCAAAPQSDQRSGRRVCSGSGRAPVRVQLGPGPDQGEPGPAGRRGHLRQPQDGPDPAVLVLRPGSTLGRGQACGRAVACRAVGLDVPVRRPRRTRGTLPFPEAPVPVSQVQGPPPGTGPGSRPPTVCVFSRVACGSPSTGGSPSPRRAGRRPSSGGCWCAAGPGY